MQFIRQSKSTALRIFSGGIIGLGVCILVLEFLLEHTGILIFLLPFPPFPVIAILIGCLLGVTRCFPPLKISISLGLFTTLVFASVLISKEKESILRHKRETIARVLIPRYPQANENSMGYSKGDGIDNEPFITMKFTSNDDFESILLFYEEQLKEWDTIWKPNFNGGLWKKGTFGIQLKNEEATSGNTQYSLIMEFWGGLWHDMRYMPSQNLVSKLVSK